MEKRQTTTSSYLKFKKLENPCKKLIEDGKCLGCNRLEDINFTGDKNCKEIDYASRNTNEVAKFE